MIKCPKCHAGSRVTDARPTKYSMRRRRMCEKCSYRWTTWEIPADLAEMQNEFKRESEQLRRRLKSLEAELVKRSYLLQSAVKTVKARSGGKTRRRGEYYRPAGFWWTDEKEKLMRELYPKQGAVALAERFGKSLAAVRSKAAKLGLRFKESHNGHEKSKRVPASARPKVGEQVGAPVGPTSGRFHGTLDVQPESGSYPVLQAWTDYSDGDS